MLTETQKYVLDLLREAFSDPVTERTLPAGVKAKDVFLILKKNDVFLTVYPVLPKEAFPEAQKQYYALVNKGLLQEHEGEAVLKTLSRKGMNVMPLKGWEYKKLYRKSLRREMADLDILVSPYRFPEISETMRELGYGGKKESAWKHDSFRKNQMNVEIHKRLTDDSGVISEWANGIFDRAKRKEDHLYEMLEPDLIVFHFVHLHKDFMNGSLGLKRLIDTWLLSKLPLYDSEEVRNHLEKFGMLSFYRKMTETARAMMGEKEIGDSDEILLRHAFTYGIYGNAISYQAGRIAAKSPDSLSKGKKKSYLQAVFLPYGRMKAQYPVLKKWPVLLPVCWGKRIGRLLRGNRKRYRALLDYSKIDEAVYEETKAFFRAGGVIEETV